MSIQFRRDLFGVVIRNIENLSQPHCSALLEILDMHDVFAFSRDTDKWTFLCTGECQHELREWAGLHGIRIVV